MKKKKGFSLVEVLVSLGITAIVLVIFFNVLLTAIGISYRTIGRNLVREEMANIENLLNRDFRNADLISKCNNTLDVGQLYPTCELKLGSDKVIWSFCDDDASRVCRKLNDSINYKTADNVVISTFTFEQSIGGVGINKTKTNILFTIVASHVNEDLEINNIVSQISVSTRNYEY